MRCDRSSTSMKRPKLVTIVHSALHSHHILPDEAWVRVPMCSPGSGLAAGRCRAHVHHPDHRLLSRSQEAIMRYGTPNIFNTDREPVYQYRVYWPAERPRLPDQHG